MKIITTVLADELELVNHEKWDIKGAVSLVLSETFPVVRDDLNLFLICRPTAEEAATENYPRLVIYYLMPQEKPWVLDLPPDMKKFENTHEMVPFVVYGFSINNLPFTAPGEHRFEICFDGLEPGARLVKAASLSICAELL